MIIRISNLDDILNENIGEYECFTTINKPLALVLMDKGCIKISNLNKKLRFKDLIDIFSNFGEITGYMVYKNDFIFEMENGFSNALKMDNFLLAQHRMRVEPINWNEFDRKKEGNVVVFKDAVFDVEDIRDECSLFGRVLKVSECNNIIYVLCASFEEAFRIHGGMYGRFYDGKRIRCFIEVYDEEKKLKG